MLETFFTKDDIEDIYDELIIYSIKKYQESEEEIKSYDSKIRKTLERQYKQALIELKRRKISIESLENKSITELKESLDNYQRNYYTILELNQPIINEIAENIKQVLFEVLSKLKTEEEKLSFLFDFSVEYFKYAQNNYQYCNQIPFTSSYFFDFKDNVPIDSNYNNTIVMGQGLCGDFANFLTITGRALGINIEKITATCNGNYHALNKVILKNGKVALIDMTPSIKNKVQKKYCFLVSEEKLKEKNNYQFTEPLPETTTIKIENLDTKKLAINLTEELEKYRPQIKDLNKRKTL